MSSESLLSGRKESLAPALPPMPVVEQFRYSKRVMLRSILGRDDGGIGLAGVRVLVGGWVKSGKEKQKPVASVPVLPVSAAPPVVKNVTCSEILVSRLHTLRSIAKILASYGCNAVSSRKLDDPPKPVPGIGYLRISDGSCTANLQIVVDSDVFPLSKILSTGTSILVEGVIARPKAPGKHAVELEVEKVLYVGSVDANKYPLSKGMISMAFLRAYPHLRPRTTTLSSIARIRNSLSYSTHQFFHSNGFLHVHMPTATNSISQGIMFVSTPSSTADDMEKHGATYIQDAKNLEAVKVAVKEKSERIEELKRSNSNKEALVVALQDLQKANKLALQLEHQLTSTLTKVKQEDISKNFFGRQMYLSSSAGLHLEAYACSLSSVYFCGPTFQIGNSPTKSLAESWKVEVELAFAELEDAMNCAEDFLRYLCHSIIENCPNDIQFMYKRIDKKCIDRIKSVGSSPFARVCYTEAVDILNKESGKKIEEKVAWGVNLSREHESFLADEIYHRPVIIYDYPKDSKPFYLRTNDDDRTVSAFDIIAPKAGKLAEGGQKEERLDKITARIREVSLAQEDYDWYLDLRRHGTVKHSGFSIGLEETVMLVTGLDDIRDVIPFPRTRGTADA